VGNNKPYLIITIDNIFSLRRVQMKRLAVILTALFVLSSPAFALDGSILDSQVMITGEKTVKITNITIDGLPGTYWAEFTWDSQLLAFKLLNYGAELNNGSVNEWKDVQIDAALPALPSTANAINGSILNSQATIIGEKTIKITNITIFGLSGVYRSEFTWDSQLLAFKLHNPGPVWREVQIDADYDMNGTTDEVTTFTYDSNGNMIKETNNDLTDIDDEIATLIYDANGRLIRDELDVWPFGSINEAGTYTYDANGRLMSRKEDSGNNGTTDAVETYTYNASGNLTGYGEDTDNNGIIDIVETYSYDANGNLTRGEGDTNNNGTIDEVFTASYDANNNAISSAFDSDNNGTIDGTGTFTYDANGNLIREEYDTDNNGTTDERYTHSWEKGPCWIGGLEDIIPDLKILGLICK
jgi:acyl-CoA-binding protein